MSSRHPGPQPEEYRPYVGQAIASIAVLAVLNVITSRHPAGWATSSLFAIAVVATLTAFPFLMGAIVSRTCTAWNRGGKERCAVASPGVLRRCYRPEHRAQWVTAPDLAGMVCMASGVGAIALVLMSR